jgi:hypothetical protein
MRSEISSRAQCAWSPVGKASLRTGHGPVLAHYGIAAHRARPVLAHYGIAAHRARPVLAHYGIAAHRARPVLAHYGIAAHPSRPGACA